MTGTAGRAPGGEAQDGKDRAVEDPRDSLHMLPLSAIPIESMVLRRAHLIKNARLETVLELFDDAATGSGQIYPGEIKANFPGIDQEALDRDIVKINQLTRMASFDVYSCRISMRALGIDVNDDAQLRLSDAKVAELSDRMKDFTRPLIRQVFGTELAGTEQADDLLAMLRNPDKTEAMRNLKRLAEELQIGIGDIPRFIEDYGDIFLSLAYFRDRLDRIVPVQDAFLSWLDELLDSWMIKHDRPKTKLLNGIKADLSDLTGSITGRFESFDLKTRDFWDDISENRFREVRNLIRSHHVTVGGVLCGLTLKMDHWRERFSRHNPGGPQQRLEFVMSEILPGLDQLKALDKAETRAGLPRPPVQGGGG
jgi:hypothetical protein